MNRTGVALISSSSESAEDVTAAVTVKSSRREKAKEEPVLI